MVRTDPARLIVLSDIALGWEVDDIQSMTRLLLYANEIDIEGLIATTSCWHTCSRPRDVRIIHRLVDTYGAVKQHLDLHAAGYPEAAQLQGVVAQGLAVYGNAPGDGFAQEQLRGNPGVRLLLAAATRDDPRPLWIALWGGANTLAQALWEAEGSLTPGDFDQMLRRLRIHAISDQDAAGKWIRDQYGERLFVVVSPSPPKGGTHYKYATWPGISADTFGHGSEDGVTGRGFTGADRTLVSRRWLRRNIRSHRPYGRRYPLHLFIMEGDTPSYLNLILNGLSDAEHPDFGGWGGRYELTVPPPLPNLEPEHYPIWTTTCDTVVGLDGRTHTSPQATIWRWRQAMQHDFAARMAWTTATSRSQANHPPAVRLAHGHAFSLHAGQELQLDASPSTDPDGDSLHFRWFVYPEAGTGRAAVSIADPAAAATTLLLREVEQDGTVHVIRTVTDSGSPQLTRYARVILTVRGARRDARGAAAPAPPRP